MIKQFEQNGMNQEISRTVAPLISNSKAIARNFQNFLQQFINLSFLHNYFDGPNKIIFKSVSIYS